MAAILTINVRICKLLSKVFAQKKGEKSYDSSNMRTNFGGFRCSPPYYKPTHGHDIASSLTDYSKPMFNAE